MAQFLCKQHGMQSPSFVSPLIARKMKDGTMLKSTDVVDLILHLPYTNKIGVFKVDIFFLGELNLNKEITNEEEALETYSTLVPVCSGCVNAYLLNLL